MTAKLVTLTPEDLKRLRYALDLASVADPSRASDFDMLRDGICGPGVMSLGNHFGGELGAEHNEGLTKLYQNGDGTLSTRPERAA